MSRRLPFAVASFAAAVTFARPSAAAFGGNPYEPYASIAACVDDRTTTCDACDAGGCGDPILSDSTSAPAECAELAPRFDDGGIENGFIPLCVVGLLSTRNVAGCVTDHVPTCPLPPTANDRASLAAADPFIQRKDCRDALDACLGSPPSTESTSFGVATISLGPTGEGGGCSGGGGGCAPSGPDLSGLSNAGGGGCRVGRGDPRPSAWLAFPLLLVARRIRRGR